LRVLRREVNLKANDPGRGEPEAPLPSTNPPG